MRRTKAEVESLIAKVKNNRIVCDSIYSCKGWEQSCMDIGIAFTRYEHKINPFKFCPYCGEKIQIPDKTA